MPPPPPSSSPLHRMTRRSISTHSPTPHVRHDLSPTPSRETHNLTRKPSLSDFLAPASPYDSDPDSIPPRPPSPATLTTTHLATTRARFLAHNPPDPTSPASILPRATVLDIYHKALVLLSQPQYRAHHQHIASEATRKVKVVLGVIEAESDDVVFFAKGCRLGVLEARWARPRIGGEDGWGIRAQGRMEVWREWEKDGRWGRENG